MEKTLQRQLLEMLQTLEEGIRYIGREGNPAMLRECITAIRAIRETCQQSLPPRHQVVYVDLFAGMAQALQQLPDQADRATLQQATALCQELIEYARQALQKEMTRKKIMVFLPYKASMWDSLESVWKAAYEDKEHCETYVIPIPYCDRNPDMTAKEWHCEAGLFPDYVPVLDWREYSRDKLREMHPDVIFIHNPYDNFNAVTSVDMQYYSRNLRGIADKLVYIPYFVVGDTIAPHFCQTQGVINADYVIVQDENIKEQYERYYPGGNPPEGKILALGSPKFDKVCNTTKDDYTLPEEWQRLIGNKKVILYNTSLTAMLEHTGKFNAKLRYVFDTFKQRDDVVLWWRPHPLLRATIDSMTPEIRDEYRQIEQQYISEGWGIYDDTPEMDRAIVCTDAYYGDMSSLVWLYRSKGNRILIQNISSVKYASVWFLDFVNCERKIYFFVPNLQLLGAMDLDTNLLCMEYDFKDKIMNNGDIPEQWHCLSVQMIGKDIIVNPFHSDELIIYNVIEKKYKKIKLDKIACIYFSYVYKNRYLYLFGQSNVVYCYDLLNESIRNIELNIKENLSDAFLGLHAYCVIEENILIPTAKDNKIIIFNFKYNTAELIAVGNEKERYIEITTDGKVVWLLTMKSCIVRWDYVSNKCRECWVDSFMMDCNIPYFVNAIYVKDGLMLFPCIDNEMSHCLYYVGSREEQIRKIDLNIHGFKGYAWVKQISDNCILAYDIIHNSIHEFDGYGKLVKQHNIEIKKSLMECRKSTLLKSRHRILMEKYDVGLDDFFNMESGYIGSKHTFSNIGNKIYELFEKNGRNK